MARHPGHAVTAALAETSTLDAVEMEGLLPASGSSTPLPSRYRHTLGVALVSLAVLFGTAALIARPMLRGALPATPSEDPGLMAAVSPAALASGLSEMIVYPNDQVEVGMEQVFNNETPPAGWTGPSERDPQLVNGPPTVPYNEARARVFASLAKLAYCGAQPGLAGSVASCSQSAEMAEVWTEAEMSVPTGPIYQISLPDRGVQGASSAYVARLEVGEETGCLVAFRGTVDNWVNHVRDMETQLIALPESYTCEGCLVHAGWWSTLADMEGEIRVQLRRAGCNSGADAKLWFTGHGSGAARAALAMYLFAPEFSVQTSYLFHSPLFANGHFVTRFRWEFGPAKPAFFVTEGPDAISRWPHSRMLHYHWIPYEVHYPDYGERDLCCPPLRRGCGVWKYSEAELRRDLDCRSQLAPGGSFCRFTEPRTTCVAGRGFGNGTSEEEEQESSPKFVGKPMKTPTAPQDWYNEGMAQCFAMLSRSLFCGKSVGLEAVLQDAAQRFCAPIGFGMVPGTLRPLSIKDEDVEDAVFSVVFKMRRTQGIGSTVPPASCVVGIRGAFATVRAHNDRIGSNQTLERIQGCFGCHVHSGYRRMWTRALGRPVVAALQELGCQRVLFTGYSFGAALAPFGMWYLQEMGYDVGLSYLFAGPRVGDLHFNQAFARKFGRRVAAFHVTANRDKVVRFPPTWHGYSHYNFQVWYSATGNFTVCEREAGCGVNQFRRAELDFRSHCQMPLALDGSICPDSQTSSDQFYTRCETLGPQLFPPLPAINQRYVVW